MLVCLNVIMMISKVVIFRRILIQWIASLGAPVRCLRASKHVLPNAGFRALDRGEAADLKVDVARADELLESGAVAAWLEKTQAFYENISA